jgi:transcriptional regulator
MEVIQGTLDMLVLRTLISGPLHGYGIAKAIETGSGGELEIEFGSLYPSLKRLELKGWLTSSWETSESNRRAKYYRLTPEGRRQAHAEHSKWTKFVNAVAAIMEPAPKGNA